MTGMLSATAFGGVWFVTTPAVSEPPPAATAPAVSLPAKRKIAFTVEAPPEDTRPPSAYSEAPKRRLPSNIYFSGCNEVRAAGLAPLYRGEPGYRPEMDGDNDGIACESYRR